MNLLDWKVKGISIKITPAIRMKIVGLDFTNNSAAGSGWLHHGGELTTFVNHFTPEVVAQYIEACEDKGESDEDLVYA